MTKHASTSPVYANSMGYVPVITFNELARTPKVYANWAMRGAIYSVKCGGEDEKSLLLPVRVAEKVSENLGPSEQNDFGSLSECRLHYAVQAALRRDEVSYFSGDEGNRQFAIAPYRFFHEAMNVQRRSSQKKVGHQLA